jgi:phosphoglycolate phosphatase-like HAD superfamily hydrolase
MMSGRPKGELRKLADRLGVSYRQAKRFGYAQLIAMKPAPRAYVVSLMKAGKKK